MRIKTGQRVEVLLVDDKWHAGEVIHTVHNDSTPLWIVRLDAGDVAVCASEACIRLIT